jgi:hypothetical protein
MGEKKSEVAKLILTASGGPFRERSDLGDITVAEALNHPTWSMGPVEGVHRIPRTEAAETFVAHRADMPLRG